MKSGLLTLFMLASCLFATGQAIFKKITDSPVVKTPGDSRSVNWVDIDNDNDLDLFITNGKEGGENNMLYVNNGKGIFTPVLEGPLVKDGEPSDGATWADFDNDGDADCFVVNWYGRNNLLYRNDGLQNGMAVFTLQSGQIPSNDGGYSETASWGDFDNDGWIDLYVTNSDGNRKNFLYKNKAGLNFEKITTGPAVNDAYISRCVNWTDFDMDGDIDLFVTNEAGQQENLYRNEDGLLTRVNGIPLVSAGGKTMSASWGDYDNDGLADVFLANDGGNDGLFHNDGNGNFSKITSGPIVNSGGNSFGSQWADVNNDGWLDLFVTNSFWGAKWQNFLFINNGDGSFTRNTTEVVATDLGWSYGAAFGDMDADGDLDLAVANCHNASQEDALYENTAADQGGQWMQLRLEGTVSNRSAIGAKLWLTATIDGKNITQLREISAQSGYCGQNQLTAHFGLGKAVVFHSLTIQWPSGLEEIFGNLAVNTIYDIREGSGITFTKNEIHEQTFEAEPPFPNPVVKQLNFNFKAHKKVKLHIQLLNQHGQLLHDQPPHHYEAGSHQMHWDLSDFDSGIYYLNINGEHRKLGWKICKS